MSNNQIPQHVGYILDGNRRWARAHSIPEYDGHLAGYNALREVLRATYEAGVPYVTIYAFSTENWSRDKSEVSSLMKLAVHAFKSDLKTIIKDRVRVRFLGRQDKLSNKILDVMEKAEAATLHFGDRTLAVCFNYGGQKEIVDAVRLMASEGSNLGDITEQDIASHLYASDIPPVDLVVRTSGEHRLSNFMTWRTVYSEFLFLDKYWPDMSREDVDAILAEYARRTRRFGT